MSKFWIQKPTAHNCPVGSSGPLNGQGAVFQDHKPTVSLQGCEWIEVVPAGDRLALIEAKITGLQEAMRPLLDQWSEMRRLGNSRIEKE